MYRYVLVATLLVALLFSAGTSAAAMTDADSPDTYFDFVKSIYNRHNKKTFDFLILELKTYIQLNPASDNIAEASYLLAEVHLEQGDWLKAFALYLKMMYIYPNSTMHTMAATQAHKIISTKSAFKKDLPRLAEIIDGDFTNDDPADRFYSYLGFLRDLGIPKLSAWSLNEYYHFVTAYVDDDRVEQVQRWVAENYETQGNYSAAAAAYLKYQKLYPVSEHLPEVRYEQAMLEYRKLKDYNRAVGVLTTIVDDYPSSSYAGPALFSRAEIRAIKLKQFDQAIADYRQLVTNMPEYEKAIDALFEIARINATKLKAYRAAVDAYDKAVELYPENELGVDALLRAADICSGKLQDFKGVAERYALIAELYPDHETAPLMLYKAGNICEKKTRDYGKAIEYYELLGVKYPNHEATSKAKTRIGKIRKIENK